MWVMWWCFRLLGFSWGVMLLVVMWCVVGWWERCWLVLEVEVGMGLMVVDDGNMIMLLVLLFGWFD